MQVLERHHGAGSDRAKIAGRFALKEMLLLQEPLRHVHVVACASVPEIALQDGAQRVYGPVVAVILGKQLIVVAYLIAIDSAAHAAEIFAAVEHRHRPLDWPLLIMAVMPA